MKRILVPLIALVAFAAFASNAAADLLARGSVEQVQVTGATPGAQVNLNHRGKHVQTLTAGSLGGVVFRDVKPGNGYRVREGATRSPKLRVLSQRPAPPSTSVYDQTIPEGYGYVSTRDGTKLAVNVQLPGPAAQGPYPTLVEYSGYGYANPDGGESSIQTIAKLLGFAVVDVNMRGTGCSGGAFDYFEPLQGLDGYDVIEAVARQPYVLHHTVGMMGVSYGGISQLFVGETNPPHLSAITPLSVIDNTATTLYPGGMLNTGFALSWAKDRVHDALPASPTGGQGWALKRIQNGDTVCKSNQDLHPEAVDLLSKIDANQFYVPKVADPLSPVTFVHKIHKPVFMACQFEDEQTGGHCPTLAAQFTGTQRKWFTFTNGAHIDSLDPLTFNRWYDFLKLYVAQQAPGVPAAKAFAPAIYSAAMGVPNVTLPDDPIQAQPTYQSALAAFEALKPVRILFDNGAGSATPGAPYPGFEQSFSRFPIPHTHARSWYLNTGGRMLGRRASGPGDDEFTWDKAARPATSFSGNTGAGGLWGTTPDYHWLANPAGSALSYVTPVLHHNVAVVGGGALRAWIKSSVPDVDLQISVSEVRADGKETFVQNGWLRASDRKLDRSKSTFLAPELSLRQRDAAPLPVGRWAKIVVPLYYQGHVYRTGSRIRVVVTAPSGDQPIWAFGNTRPSGTATVHLAHSRRRASRLVLPIVPGVSVPTAAPPCPGLRGEACRTYTPYVNTAG
jgi:predicted acyl esterase